MTHDDIMTTASHYSEVDAQGYVRFCEDDLINFAQALLSRAATLQPADDDERALDEAAPLVDERALFEAKFKMPAQCVRCGDGYAVTGYEAWDAATFVRRWEGWRARAAFPQSPKGDERTRFEQALRETYQMVDPLNPPPAGTYYRGQHEGIIAALKTIRENFDRAAAPQAGAGLTDEQRGYLETAARSAEFEGRSTLAAGLRSILSNPTGKAEDAQAERLDVEAIAKQFLLETDFAALFVFESQCKDSDADGYTERAEMMARLAELGVVQRFPGRGKRYGMTAFGSWLIEAEFAQNPSLPLRTIEEHNERERRGHTLYLKESAPHSEAWLNLSRDERESWRRKAMTAAQPESGGDRE